MLKPEDFNLESSSRLDFKESLKNKLSEVDPGWSEVFNDKDPVCEFVGGKHMDFGGAASLEKFRDQLLKEHLTGEDQNIDHEVTFLGQLSGIFQSKEE